MTGVEFLVTSLLGLVATTAMLYFLGMSTSPIVVGAASNTTLLGRDAPPQFVCGPNPLSGDWGCALLGDGYTRLGGELRACDIVESVLGEQQEFLVAAPDCPATPCAAAFRKRTIGCSAGQIVRENSTRCFLLQHPDGTPCPPKGMDIRKGVCSGGVCTINAYRNKP